MAELEHCTSFASLPGRVNRLEKADADASAF